MSAASYTTPSSTCVRVFISGKLGLKPISVKILGLKLERTKVDWLSTIGPRKKPTGWNASRYMPSRGLGTIQTLSDMILGCIGAKRHRIQGKYTHFKIQQTMYCDPSFTCVPVFILEKLGLKLPTRVILVLKDLWVLAFWGFNVWFRGFCVLAKARTDSRRPR